MATSPGGTSPSLGLRRGLPADAEACGRICYDAFRAIAERHGFPPDFPSPADAVATVGRLLAHPGFHAIVAESDGRVVGSNFLDERSTIAGLGPITVDPGVQNAGVGRRLMLAAIERVRERQAPGVRLLQSAYHNRSLSLYTTLGFNVREPVVTLQGAPIRAEVPGYRVRPASDHDLEAGNRVCVAVHGHDRSGELLRCHQGGQRPRRRARGTDLGLHNGHRLLRPLGRRDQRRPEGPDRRRAGVRGARLPAAGPQRRALPLVSRPRAPRRAGDDADDPRPL